MSPLWGNFLNWLKPVGKCGDAARVGVNCGEHVLLDIAHPSDLVTLHTPRDDGKVTDAGEPLLLFCGGHHLAWEPEQFEVALLRVPKGPGRWWRSWGACWCCTCRSDFTSGCLSTTTPHPRPPHPHCPRPRGTGSRHSGPSSTLFHSLMQRKYLKYGRKYRKTWYYLNRQNSIEKIDILSIFCRYLLEKSSSLQCRHDYKHIICNIFDFSW